MLLSSPLCSSAVPCNKNAPLRRQRDCRRVEGVKQGSFTVDYTYRQRVSTVGWFISQSRQYTLSFSDILSWGSNILLRDSNILLRDSLLFMLSFFSDDFFGWTKYYDVACRNQGRCDLWNQWSMLVIRLKLLPKSGNNLPKLSIGLGKKVIKVAR